MGFYDFDKLSETVEPTSTCTGGVVAGEVRLPTLYAKGTAAECEKMCIESELCIVFHQWDNECALLGIGTFESVCPTGIGGKSTIGQPTTLGRIGVVIAPATRFPTEITVGDCRHWTVPDTAAPASARNTALGAAAGALAGGIAVGLGQ
jgi:hypothetical protein